MTYHAKLAAQEVLALPDRELLDPLTLWDLVHWVLDLSRDAATPEGASPPPADGAVLVNRNVATATDGGDASSQQCLADDCVQQSEQTDLVVVNE